MKKTLVNSQIKTGYWISINDIESECSECGHREPNERFIFEDINFCAKCGIRMVEPQFQGEDVNECQRMIQTIKSAIRCKDEVNNINNRFICF